MSSTFSGRGYAARIIVGFVFSSMLGWAQTSNASISGLVTDPSGSVIAGAKVTVTDLVRNTNYSVQTNQTGLYRLSQLIPGAYKIAAEMSGFKSYVVDTLQLSTQQEATLNITLQVGNVSEQVEVKAQAQMVDAENAALSGVVENKKIIDLPLNNRNIFSLVTLVPGVSPSGLGFQQNDFFIYPVRFSVNGGLESTTDIQLDGISSVTQSDIPGIEGVSALPSVDSIQEFRIQTNAYSAEYGRSGGGLVTLLTRSGTNSFHGDLFEFLRNNVLDSNNFFANRAGTHLPPLQQNQYGASLGGPVIKNRTFFFAVYEGKRQNQGTFSTFTVPTDLERKGDFSQTFNAQGQLRVIYDPFSTRPDPSHPGQFIRDPFLGNAISQSLLIDKVAQKAASYYPEPNAPGLPFTHQNNLNVFSSVLFPTERFDFRVDHNFSETKRFFVRYNYTSTTSGDVNFWNNVASPVNGLLPWNSHDAVVDYTQVIGSNTVLDLRGGFDAFRAFRGTYANNFDLTSLGLPASLQTYAQQGGAALFPTFTIQDESQLGPTAAAYYKSANTRYNGLASVSHVFGRHSVKAGADLRFFYLNFFQYSSDLAETFSRTMTQGGNPLTPSATAGVGFASFLLGAGDSGYSSFQIKPANASRYFGMYVQDDYKLTPRLTVNLGFRLEAETATTERHDQLVGIDPTVLNPISQKVGSNVTGGYLFAGGSLGGRAIRGVEWKPNPRIGVAYQVSNNNVIRAGYGIFYGITPAAATDYYTGSPYSITTPLLATLDSVTPNALLKNPFPQGFVYPPGSSAGLLSAVGTSLVGGWPQALKSPYNQQFNLSVQHEFGTGMLLQLAYAGNKGVHLPAFLGLSGPNMNQLPPSVVSAQQSNLTKLVDNPFYNTGLITSGVLAQKQVQLGQLLRPFPEWTDVRPINDGWGNSSYHSLQILFEKRFGAGTSLTAAYTWSKSIDDIADGIWTDATSAAIGSYRNWYCFSCEKAVSIYDVPQRLVVNFTYELPFGKGKMFGNNWNRVTNLFLGGWQTNGILSLNSGTPLRFGVSSNTTFSFGGGQHPDFTGVDPSLGGGQSFSAWFNNVTTGPGASFVQPAAYTFGNLGRTYTGIRTDWLKNMDFSLFKKFDITERFNLEFRAEAFNLSNTVVFGAPNTTVGSPVFGVVSSQANSPRQVQLGLKLMF